MVGSAVGHVVDGEFIEAMEGHGFDRMMAVALYPVGSRRMVMTTMTIA